MLKNGVVKTSLKDLNKYFLDEEKWIMKRAFKIIVTSILVFGLCYFVYFFYGIMRYSHSADWQTYKQYMWIFKDSVRNSVDTNFSYSFVKKKDVYTNFHYRSINLLLWDFKDVIISNLSKVTINHNINLDDVKFGSGEILNKGSDMEITIKYGFAFNNNININLDRYSKIERNIEGANYKGFYGVINRLALSDEKGKQQILFDYTNGQTPTVFIVYKGCNSFYIIMINSEQPIDENIINMLNLE